MPGGHMASEGANREPEGAASGLGPVPPSAPGPASAAAGPPPLRGPLTAAAVAVVGGSRAAQARAHRRTASASSCACAARSRCGPTAVHSASDEDTARKGA
jgi:hypothetical protein